MKKINLIIVFCLAFASAFAQYTTPQNVRWMFGNRAGVDFTSGSPTAVTSSMNAVEGTTTISDASGSLLYYSEGEKIWNRTGAIMPSGSALVSYSTASATQACLSIPVVGVPTQYYVFSLEGVPGGSAYCRLSYCIVDMSLSGGLGDVVASTLGTPVGNVLSEKMVAVPGNDCNIWLIIHRKDSAKFLAYSIDASGISAPVVSTVGTFTTAGSYGGYSIGAVKVSHDRSKIVTADWNSGGSMGAELHDFNATTGVVSNCIVLDSTTVQYGAEFSPDDTKLYLETSSTISQFDLSAGSAAAIRASRYSVGACAYWSGLRLGPNNKIYFGASSTAALGAINNPNVAGSGCGYTASSVSLASGTSFTLGLPSEFFTVGGGDTTFTRRDTVVCIPTAGLTLTARTTGATTTNYLWDNGATTITRSITVAGTYWVAIDTGGCHRELDTIVVTTPTPINTTRIHDTSVCSFSFPITLTATGGFTTYHWQSGATTATYSAATAGTYWVWAADSCNNLSVDTFHVNFIIPDTTAGSATTYTPCITTAPLALTASAGYAGYRWNTGSTAATINAFASGTYWVFKRTGCSLLVDTFHVAFIPVPTLNLGADVAICIGDSIILSSTQPAGTTYTWSTGSKADSIHVKTSGTYWLRLFNGCTITDSIHILVSPYPVVDLGPDTFNCLGAAVTLQSTGTYTFPTYLWSDGSGAPTDVVTSTGNYWLKVTVAGCSSADTIHVDIVYDTFRLFNGDTAICKGKVVQAVLNANPAATFQWLPTAGIATSTVRSPLITPDTTAMYRVIIHLAGCPDVSDSFLVDVQPVPDVYIGGNRFICLYDTIHINSNVKPTWYTGYIYSWSPATSLDFTNTPTVVFTAGVTQKYFLTVTTSAGCTGKDSAQLIVQGGDFGGVNQDFAVCPHDSVLLTGTGGAGYSWHPGLYLSDSNAANPWVKPISDITYHLVVTSSVGCHDTVSVHVTVHPAALITLADSITLYPGETTQLSPVTNCNTFLWFPPAGLNSATVSDPVANPEITTRYTVHGITSDGCVAIDSIDLIISPESLLILPNAFTPGTGVNNKFSVIKRGEATLNHFRIFNRWGEVVFETTNVNDGWDGTFKGAPQPLGVYVYDVQAVTKTGKLFNKKGNVTLLR